MGVINIDKVTIANNVASDAAGVNAQGASNIAASVFTANAGIALTTSGNSVVRDCIFEANTGSGISNNGILAVTDSKFLSNTSTIGGGLLNRGTATIVKSNFENNSASNFGGAVANDSQFGNLATISIAGSTIHNNRAAFGGGGIYNFSGSADIANSTISNNVASDGTGFGSGGGVYNSSFGGFAGVVQISNSTVRNNTAHFGGGGVLNFGFTTLTVTASTLHGNSSTLGGAAYNQGFSGADASMTFDKSTIGNNTASSLGAGVYNDGQFGGLSSIQIVASTISGNAAGSQGGGIYNIVGVAAIGNTIVAKNSAASAIDVFGTFASAGYKLVGAADGSTGFGVTGDLLGSAATPINPKLGTLKNNGGQTWTFALLVGSPALNSGNPALTGQTDQRGVSRPQGTRVDIGAFELKVGGPTVLNLQAANQEEFDLRRRNRSAT